MQRWIIISLVVLAILYRKRIAAWLDATGAPTDKDLPASAKTGLENLSASISGNPVFDQLKKIQEQLLASKQKSNEADLIDDYQPLNNLIMSQSDFILLAKPETSKIFAQAPVSPEEALNGVEKVKIKSDYLWWPEIMHQNKPEFNYFGGCNCGGQCGSGCKGCGPKTFSWL